MRVTYFEMHVVQVNVSSGMCEDVWRGPPAVERVNHCSYIMQFTFYFIRIKFDKFLINNGEAFNYYYQTRSKK